MDMIVHILSSSEAMIAFSIVSSDTKGFMSKLLKEGTFDSFFVRKAEVTTIAKFEINGALNKDFLNGEETMERTYCTWGEIRPYFFGIIRGSKRPRNMKIIFSYSDTSPESFHPNARALFLNFTYENSNILMTTGTAQKNFTLDKDMDILWDDFIKQFFKEREMIISTQ